MGKSARQKNVVLLYEKYDKNFPGRKRHPGKKCHRFSYTFSFVIKYCRENEICDFKKHKATKKEVAENSELTHRKEYLQIKLGAGQGVELIKLNPPQSTQNLYLQIKL